VNSAKAMLDKRRVRSNKRVSPRDWVSVTSLLIMLAFALTFMTG